MGGYGRNHVETIGKNMEKSYDYYGKCETSDTESLHRNIHQISPVQNHQGLLQSFLPFLEIQDT
jgi:hypothetical protein